MTLQAPGFAHAPSTVALRGWSFSTRFKPAQKRANKDRPLLARAPGAEACSNKRCSASKSPHQ